MAQQKGSTVEVLLGWESSFGTAPSAAFSLPINPPLDVVPSQNMQTPATLIGNRNPAEPFFGNKSVDGNLTIPLDSAAMPYWLKAMFDDESTTGTGPYVHEYKITDAMPSFTLEEAFTDLAVNRYQQLLGCKIANAAFNFGGDGELVCTLGIVGAEGNLASSSMDGTPTSVALSRVNNFQAAIEEGGAGISVVTAVDISIDFGLDTSDDQIPIGNSGVRRDLPEGTVAVTGTLRALFEDTSLLTKAQGQTETSLKITVTASASSVFELELQELYYADTGITVPGPTGLLVELPFSAFYGNGSEASAIVARITNNTASY